MTKGPGPSGNLSQAASPVFGFTAMVLFFGVGGFLAAIDVNLRVIDGFVRSRLRVGHSFAQFDFHDSDRRFAHVLGCVHPVGRAPGDVSGFPVLVIDRAVGRDDPEVSGVEVNHDPVLFVFVQGARFGYGFVVGPHHAHVVVFDGAWAGWARAAEASKKKLREGFIGQPFLFFGVALGEPTAGLALRRRPVYFRRAAEVEEAPYIQRHAPMLRGSSWHPDHLDVRFIAFEDSRYCWCGNGCISSIRIRATSAIFLASRAARRS